jgi:hypothetical protein
MANLPETFDHAGIHCYRRASDPATLLYIPGAPSPQRAPDGTPMISLLRFAPHAFLQLSAQWDVADEQLGALRAALAAAYPGLDAASVRLEPAPIQVERAALELTGPDGTAAELQSSDTSGMPPYTALFNLQLDEAQQAATAAALGGRTGLLAVRYRATLAGRCSPEPIERVGDVATWFGAHGGIDHFQVVG